MFSGTVSSNVAYGENGLGEYSEEAVKRAVSIAQASDFVEGMETSTKRQSHRAAQTCREVRSRGFL